MAMTIQPVSSTTDIEKLSQAVAGLTEALALSEKRSARLRRNLRWGILGGLSLLCIGGAFVAQRPGIAQPHDPAGFPQATTAVEALNNINANLMVLGQLGKTLQEFTPVIKQAVLSNPDVQQYVQDYFTKNDLKPSAEEQEAYAMQAIMGSVVGTFVDTVVLMQRIREDSNAFRAYVTGPEEVLRGVERQLEAMNVAMAAIPPMAAEMNLMNRNMASMSYSMGSTMGRVGSWMPW